MSEPVITESVRTVYVPIYTVDGRPTCAASLDKTCRFYGTEAFGTREVCLFPTPGVVGVPLHRDERPEAFGYLQPHGACPLWRDRT